MENVKIIIVEPLYQQNIGYIARVLKNFGIGQMHLVRPRCKFRGKEAIKYSKHAVDILKRAKVYRSIEDATKDRDTVIGTTGIWYKSDSSFFNVFPASKIKSLITGKKAAILIGRDDTGLTKEEFKLCDAIVFVPTDGEYPVLNISHALAILLYEISRSGKLPMSHMYAGRGAAEGLSKLFLSMIKNRADIRNKKAVAMAFKHIITRANTTRKELNALAIAFSTNKKGDSEIGRKRKK